MSKTKVKLSSSKNSNLFDFDEKTDYLVIGLFFLLLAFFLIGGFLLR